MERVPRLRMYGQKRRGMVRRIGEGLGKRKPPFGGGSMCSVARGLCAG